MSWDYDADTGEVTDELGTAIVHIDPDGYLPASDEALAAFAAWLCAEGPARLVAAMATYPFGFPRR